MKKHGKLEYSIICKLNLGKIKVIKHWNKSELRLSQIMNEDTLKKNILSYL